ncbi:MAG: hypothetical protein ACYDD1_09685 [Caulobacteraceae bacterium]
MAHFKLNETDDTFLETPQGALLVSSGTNGTESWLERDKDVTVRLVVATVAIATSDGATLAAVIEVNGATARAEDGPASSDTHLQAVQSVQIALKAGERVTFKAGPQSNGAKVMKTNVYAADIK